MIKQKKKSSFIIILTFLLLSLACGFIDPLREQVSSVGLVASSTPTEPTRTPRPTFTATPVDTPTPTFTLTPIATPTVTDTPTPTLTPIPSDTPIPTPTNTVPPTETFTPAPPTKTFTPRPPTATFTPAPTATPSYPFKVIEGPIGFPTTNSILVMYIAITNGNNVPIGGLKVVGDHSPSGTHYVSGESCFDFCKANGQEGTIKFGNVTFEPPTYETGVWHLYVIDGGGAQISDIIPVTVNFDSPGWFFIALRD